MRWLGVACLLLAVGCGDDDGVFPGSDAGRGVDDDGGGGGADAGAALDAGPAFDAGAGEDFPGVPPVPMPGVEPGARFEDETDPGNAGACYDRVDNNDNGDGESLTDCDDPLCAVLPSCCVDSTASECCAPTLPRSDLFATLDACEAAGPEGCVAGARAFGVPRPLVDRGGVLFGGDSSFDSGIVLERPYDLRSETVLVRADVVQATECGADCLESVAIGVTRDLSLPDTAHVDPLVAVVISGSSREARMMVGSRVIQVWEAVGDSTWTLALHPDGRVEAGPEGGRVGVAFFERADTAYLAAWGHSRNPSATDDRAARITSLEVESSLCDVPSAWSVRAPLSVEDAVPLNTEGARGPSIAMTAAGPLVAFEQNGAIYAALGTDTARPERFFVTTNAPTEALLDVSGETLRDPELVPGEEMRLYYLQDGPEGTSLRARPVVADGDAVGDEIVNVPAIRFGGVIAHPTIARINPRDRPERYAMVMWVDGSLRSYASVDGVSWMDAGEVPIDVSLAGEVGAASLVVVNGGYQLLVAVRRATRWSLALLASAELVHWRLVDERALGDGAGRDALGARDADAMLEDGTLTVVYVGLDGTRETLHRTERAIPTLVEAPF
ncbi:MAG: hypothetical protein AAGE52_29300 [Myxococcota bacterium]